MTTAGPDLAIHPSTLPGIEPTPELYLDETLNRLSANKARWATARPETCLALLDACLRDVSAVGEGWVAANVAGKQMEPGGDGEVEEWLQFAIVPRLLRQLRLSLADIAAHGAPRLPYPPEQRADGRVAVQVYPRDQWDRYSLPGITGEIRMARGETPEQVAATPAEAYRRQDGGRLTLVLGAGNASPLVPGDFLHQLFVERSVVLLKMNPVNAYLGPIIEEGFRALINEGVLAVVYGGIEAGAYLCEHPMVDAIHMTGSDRTYEAIVFGPGAEGEQRKAAGLPRLTKPVTAELGNITPVIVVPGPWTEADIALQAGKIASQFVINAAFNCLTPRLVVQWRQWPQRASFVEAIGAALSAIPTRQAYYPGAQDRHSRFVEAYPAARQIGACEPGALPWTLISDIPADDPDALAIKMESFCSVLAETAVDADDPAAFVEQAVEFLNSRVWGTLAAILLVHPESAGDPRLNAAIERAVDELRYGSIVINQPTVLAYMLATTPWGGAPGQPPHDIQSGTGFVNNTLMLARPEKSVVRGPFRQKGFGAQNSKRPMIAFGRAFASFQTEPSAGRLVRMLWALLRP